MIGDEWFMRSGFFSAAVIFLAIVGPRPAHAAGDPQAGAKLAQQYCARCHDIGPAGASKQYPPSFAAIAAYRSEEQIHGRIIFPTMHSGMPEVALYLLEPEQIADIISYILSLEKKTP
jgi:mono/diheme cytochrome c family protein